jgi:hypothetical protein
MAPTAMAAALEQGTGSKGGGGSNDDSEHAAQLDRRV